MGALQQAISSYATTDAPTLDTDAVAFLTATGISDGTISAAIDALVVALKADGIWAKAVGIYPYIGGTADTHKYNLKDPRDLDAAFRITWSGTVTHNANGITGNGTTGEGDTHIDSSSDLSQNSKSLAAYVRNNIDGGFDIGNGTLIDRFDLLGSLNGAQFYGYLSDLNGTAVPNSDSRGFWCVSRLNGTHLSMYKDGAAAGTNPKSSASSPQASQTIRMLRGSTQFSSHNHAFGWVGEGLTDAEVSDLYDIVQAFQTALGRNV